MQCLSIYLVCDIGIQCLLIYPVCANTVLSINETLCRRFSNIFLYSIYLMAKSICLYLFLHSCIPISLSFILSLVNFVDVLASKRQRENYLQASWLITRLQLSPPLPTSPPLLFLTQWTGAKCIKTSFDRDHWGCVYMRRATFQNVETDSARPARKLDRYPSF